MKPSFRQSSNAWRFASASSTRCSPTADVAADMKRYRKLGREHAEASALVDALPPLRAARARPRLGRQMLAEWRATRRWPSSRARNRRPRRPTRAPARRAAEGAAAARPRRRRATSSSRSAPAPAATSRRLFAGDLFAHVPALRRAQALAGRDHLREPERARRLQGSRSCASTARRVYAKLKFESGGHRVQRVPATETQGRIHTSRLHGRGAARGRRSRRRDARTRASCASTPSARAAPAASTSTRPTRAIRVTHLPTGIVVECQDDRSQHKNKAKALRVLAARISDKQERRAHGERGIDAQSA